MFRVNQQVVCVDDSLAANPWHRANPLVKNRVYAVYALAGPECIEVDISGRAWQNWRFRPVVSTGTGMAVLEQIRRDVTNKELRPIFEDEQA